jgi:predicted metal-binding protein
MSQVPFDRVKVCSSCARRAEDRAVGAFGEKICGLVKRELERDGLAGEIAVSARPCFRECPANGVAVALFADSGFQPEWHVVRTPADLDFLYARLIGEA